MFLHSKFMSHEGPMEVFAVFGSFFLSYFQMHKSSIVLVQGEDSVLV